MDYSQNLYSKKPLNFKMYYLLQIHRRNTSNMATVEVRIVSGWTADTPLSKTAQ